MDNFPKPRRGRIPRLTDQQLRCLHEMLLQGPESNGYNEDKWSSALIAKLVLQHFDVAYHPNYIPRILRKVRNSILSSSDDHQIAVSDRITLYLGDAQMVLAKLPTASVDCVVTSPPYYGQRDYGVAGQIGLEPHPQQYIDRLLAVFSELKRVLKPTGSLWVNLGDTYWSGKGRPHGHDLKQKHRRFLRPQDRSGPRPLCTPKQLLLIPHRFAIAMQEDGWIVRNDNVWHKSNPTPDPIDDRCASAHEYMFHFVMRRRYHFDSAAIAVPSMGEKATKAPSSVWSIKSAPTFKKHAAVFPEELVRIPILATLPDNGVLLDPFCGSGTALCYAKSKITNCRLVGIDISQSSLDEAQELLSKSD